MSTLALEHPAGHVVYRIANTPVRSWPCSRR